MATNALRRILRPGRPAPLGELPHKREYLRKIDIFRDLSHDEIEAIDRSTRMVAFERDRVIYRQDDRSEGLYLIKTGRIRLSRIGPGGKKLDLAVLGAGTFFGEMPMLGEWMRSSYAEAVEDCLLCVMSRRELERLVLDQPHVGLRMIHALSRRLAESEARLEDLAYRSVSARLASVLLRLCDGDGAVDGLSHEELGDMVGAYRETVTKTLNEFRAGGLVKLGRRRIRVLDRAGLSALLEGA